MGALLVLGSPPLNNPPTTVLSTENSPPNHPSLHSTLRMADFDTASQAFLAWLRQSGADISPKIHLEDLRSRDAGRGVGKYPSAQHGLYRHLELWLHS